MRKLFFVLILLMCTLPFASAGAVYVKEGNVGIGISSPDSLLHLKKDGLQLLVDFDASNSVVKLQTGMAGGSFLSLEPNGGKVGIGKTNPAVTLDVAGDTDVAGNIKINKASQPALLYAMGDGKWKFGVWTETGGNLFHISRYDNNGDHVERVVTINRDNGYVGIGTLAPSDKMDIFGNLRVQGWIAGSTDMGGLKLFGDRTSTQGLLVKSDGSVKIDQLAGTGSTTVCVSNVGTLSRC